MKNIIKYFMVMVAFIVGIFVLDATEAHAYALYYGNSPIGVKYDADGYVRDVSNSVMLYGQEVKAGYAVASSDSLKITDFKVKVGNSNYVSVSSSYYSISTKKFDSAPSGYSIETNKNTDVYTVKMKDILNDYFPNTYQENSIYVTISLQRKEPVAFWTSWKDYTSITYYNGDTSANSIAMKRTSNAFFKTQVVNNISQGRNLSTSYQLSDGEKYYNRSANKVYYSYNVTVPFVLKSGSVSAKYQYTTYRENYVDKTTPDTQNRTTSCTSDYGVFTQSTTSSSAILNYNCFSPVFTNDVYRKVTFTDLVVTATDKYNNALIGESINVSDETFTVATEIPTISSIKIETLKPSPFSGAVKLNVTYNLNGFDYKNGNSYTVELTSIVFRVGSKDVVIEDGNTYSLDDGDFSFEVPKITKGYTIYSNQGTGDVTFRKFNAVINDKYGNVKNHVNDTSIEHEQPSIKLESNVEGSSFKTDNDIMYYYNGDKMAFTLKLIGLPNVTVSGIKLANDSGDEYLLYNETITRTIEGAEQTYSLVSDTITFTGSVIWTKVILLDVKEPTDGGEIELYGDYPMDYLLYFNQYIELTSYSQTINSTSFTINGIKEDEVGPALSKDNIVVENLSSAQLAISSCTYVKEEGQEGYVRCSYYNKNSLDGNAKVTVGRGTIKLNNGLKNEKLELELIENKRNPEITFYPQPIEFNEGVYEDLSIRTYFYKGAKQLKLTLTDGYCASGAFTYTIKDGEEVVEYKESTFTCMNSLLEDNEVYITLPSDDGTYTIEYSLVTDEVELFETTSEYTYISRSELDFDASSIIINDGVAIEENYFNSIKVVLSDVREENMLDKYRIQFEGDLAYTATSIVLGNNTFNYTTNNREELNSLNGDRVNFTITLIDKLGNIKSYDYSVVIDTITPVSPDPRVSKLGDEYVISINNYDEYNDYDTITIAFGEEESYCVKGQDDECNFNIGTHTIFALKSIDKAGNTNGVSTYTTEEAKVQIANSYLSISPFTPLVYNPKNDVVVKIYKYAYSLETLEDYTNISKVCTNVTTINCYTRYSLTSESMYDIPSDADELNIKMSTFNLESNHSYIFIVTLGNSSLPLNHVNGGYPRLNLEYRDTQGPTLIESSVDSNPYIVSDSVNTMGSFMFTFAVNDINLDEDSYFEYLIINSDYVTNYTISNTMFNEYLSYCPRNLSAYKNKCGQWSNSPVKYSQVDENQAVGSVYINHNGRMLNNTSYLLFVKSYDSYGNYTIDILNQFINISDAINIYYKDGDLGTKKLANDGVVKTVNKNANLMVETRSDLLAPVSVELVTLDGNRINIDNPNGYKVSEGEHQLVVTDSLGNVKITMIYCGALTKPEIEVYNFYNGAYYKITSDTNFAYNSDTLNNLYVKIIATNLQNFSVYDGKQDTVYDSQSEEYETITTADYGINLSKLLSQTSGTVTIKAMGDAEEPGIINLVIDNMVPEINIFGGAQSNTSVYLFDVAHNIVGDGNGTYTLDETNYRYELNYEYLFNKLALRIDGELFKDIKNVSNVIVKLDGTRVLDYTKPIATDLDGGLIAIEYFDDAGNVAKPLYINIKIVDKEAPVLGGLDETRTVEANTTVSLLDEKVTASDNYDKPEDIIVTFKINGEEIPSTSFTAFKLLNYNFSLVGRYTLTIVVTDTHNNSSSVYTQELEAIDTTAPVIVDTFSLTGMNLSYTSAINLPSFQDSDFNNTIYYPSVIEFYMGDKLIEDTYYTLTVENYVASVRFNDEAKTGTYTMLLKTMDIYGNVSIEKASFALTDITLPVINVYVNGLKVDGDSARMIYGDHSQTFNYEAIDSHDGKLNVIKTGDTINYDRQGEYKITLTAKDKSNNTATRVFTIIVEPDTEKPIIEKVTLDTTTLMPSNQSMPIYNELNYKYANINVVAKDNAGIERITIEYDGEIAGNNTLVRLIDGRPFTIIVDVVDIAGNTITSTYYVRVDNSAPKIDGVKDKQVYDAEVEFAINDIHLDNVTISKDNEIILNYDANAETSYNKSFTENGVYEIIAIDTYKNQTRYLFEIRDSLIHKVKYDDGTIENIENDATFLVRAEINVQNRLEIYFDYNSQIDNEDEVYILISYPGSDELKEIYSMSGRYYLSNSKVEISGVLIDGTTTESTLNNVGREYYAYAMVIKADVVEETPSQSPSNNQGNDSLKGFFTTILVISIFVLILYVIIKFRRKVRSA